MGIFLPDTYLVHVSRYTYHGTRVELAMAFLSLNNTSPVSSLCFMFQISLRARSVASYPSICRSVGESLRNQAVFYRYYVVVLIDRKRIDPRIIPVCYRSFFPFALTARRPREKPRRILAIVTVINGLSKVVTFSCCR